MENSIGEKIRAERENRKMSQETLAERLGISQQAIHAYEKGKMKPKIEKLIRISAALNVPVELFLPDELNENEMVRKIKEEYDRGYQAGREAMKKELMEHMQIWLSKKEEKQITERSKRFAGQRERALYSVENGISTRKNGTTGNV